MTEIYRNRQSVNERAREALRDSERVRAGEGTRQRKKKKEIEKDRDREIQR